MVKNNEVTGIFKNKVKENNRLKTANVDFAKYDETGDGLRALGKIKINFMDPNNRCLCTAIAVNTENEEIKYYVQLTAAREECWYDCGED